MISEQPVAECCSGIKGNIMGLWIHLVKELKLCSQKKNPKHHKTKEDEILQNAVSVLAWVRVLGEY